MNQRRPLSKRRFIIRWTSVITLVAALVISLNAVIFTQFRTVFNNFFQPSLQRSQALTEATADITERIEAEGIVLLRNDDAALPLGASERRVNVFGWSSTMPVYGGTGSGAVDASSAVTFLDGLTNAGIEYNTEITDFIPSSVRTVPPSQFARRTGQCRNQAWMSTTRPASSSPRSPTRTRP